MSGAERVRYGRTTPTTYKAGAGGFLMAVDAITALHSDPSFEDASLADWNFDWPIGNTATHSSSTDSPIEADRSLVLTIPTGQSVVPLSDTFDIAIGGIVTGGVWARVESGSADITVGALTAPSGTPVFFDGVSQGPETEAQDFTADYTQQQGTFIARASDAKARLFFRVTNTGGSTATVRLDLSSSAVTGRVLSPQSGTTTVSLTAASQGFNTITFPTAFADAPAVQVTTENAAYFGNTANVTATQCRVYVSHRDGTNATTSVVAHWTASPKN